MHRRQPNSHKKDPIQQKPFIACQWDGTALVQFRGTKYLRNFRVTPKAKGRFTPQSFLMYDVVDNKKQLIRLPFLLVKDQVDKIYDCRPTPLRLKLPLNITYRTGQEVGVNEIVSTLTHHDECILNADPGSGKTVMAIATAIKMDMGPVLILAHKNKLLKQFAETLKWMSPEARIGVLGDDKLTKDIIKDINPNTSRTLDKDIQFLLISVRSLMSRNMAVSGGFLIVDEAHVASAPDKFSKVLYKLRYKKSLALSATFERNDGLDIINRGFFGSRTVTVVSETMTSKGFLLEIPSGYANSWEEEFLLSRPDGVVSSNDVFDFMKMRKSLSKEPTFQASILSVIKYFHDETDRKMIVFGPSDNAICDDYLGRLRDMKLDVGKYYGPNVTNEQRQNRVLAESCRILLTHESNVKEGDNFPDRSLLIFTYTPKGKSLKQLGGRIERILENAFKPEPFIVVPHDGKNKIMSRMLGSCKRHFVQNNNPHVWEKFNGNESELRRIFN